MRLAKTDDVFRVNWSPNASNAPHALGSEADVLGAIVSPAVNFAVWQRPVNPAIMQELQALKVNHLPDRRRRVTLESFDGDLCRLLQQQGLNAVDFANFRTDLKQLVDQLADVCGAREFIYRLATIGGDECRRFHLDSTPFRLVCTFQGPGTEWLTDAQVDRAALAKGAADQTIIRSGKPSRLDPFWVGILKGGSARTGQGLVHRSPSIAGSGQIRVLFCLDCEAAPGIVKK